MYKEELAAKTATKATAKKDSNIQSNIDQEASKGGKQKGQGDKGNKGDKSNKDGEDNESQKKDKGSKEDTVKYIIIND